MKHIRENNFQQFVRSPELDEIIGRPPSWIVKWGITIVVIIISVLLSLSYFITYSETIEIPISIVREDLKFPIISQNKSLVSSIFTVPGQIVLRNQKLYQFHTIGGIDSTLTSPISGKIAYSAPFFEGQLIDKGQILFYISPANSTYQCFAYVNAKVKGQVKQGLAVSVSFKGTVEKKDRIMGTIDYLSSIKFRNGYYLHIDLSQSIAELNKIDVFDDEKSSAKIYLGKRRLFQKIFTQ